MIGDPWILVGWALLILLVIAPIGIATFVIVALRNHYRATKAFKRRRAERARTIDVTPGPLAVKPSQGIARGDRAVFLGLGQLRGKHGTVLAVRPKITSIRFDTGVAVLTLTADVHPIPRRPPPDFD